MLPLDHPPSYATLPLHSPSHADHSQAPHHTLHSPTLHTLCCSTAPLSTPCLYATHDVASETPTVHSPLHASTPPTTLPPTLNNLYLPRRLADFLPPTSHHFPVALPPPKPYPTPFLPHLAPLHAHRRPPSPLLTPRIHYRISHVTPCLPPFTRPPLHQHTSPFSTPMMPRHSHISSSCLHHRHAQARASLATTAWPEAVAALNTTPMPQAVTALATTPTPQAVAVLDTTPTPQVDAAITTTPTPQAVAVFDTTTTPQAFPAWPQVGAALTPTTTPPLPRYDLRTPSTLPRLLCPCTTMPTRHRFALRLTGSTPLSFQTPTSVAPASDAPGPRQPLLKTCA
ncbi:hypothetical protein Pcinc_003757 [Petrolisthes cinctipes]|uniref:Uncharacterized protein n=1 Tax=Petrolisthes cinctipes TaxID=88211 RepID=A0AAE1L291_PETCI|nr:hypothetical protein Pcinc_003757 [Petrolisthes cinctipes]